MEVYSGRRGFAKGNKVRYEHSAYSGIKRTYILQARTNARQRESPLFYQWSVTNPKSYVMTQASAENLNPILLPGDKLYLYDKNKLVKNEYQAKFSYSELISRWDSINSLLDNLSVIQINKDRPEKYTSIIKVYNVRNYGIPERHYALNTDGDITVININQLVMGASVKIRFEIMDDFVSGGGTNFDNFTPFRIYVRNRTTMGYYDHNFDTLTTFNGNYNYAETFIAGDFIELVIRSTEKGISALIETKNVTTAW